MGLKSIEMQVAIPRSQDAGKMQEQLSRQGQQFQETLTEQQLREEIIKRHKTNRQEKVLKREVDEDEDRANEQEHQERNEDNEEKQHRLKQKMRHPYLGRQIDWSG